ncbi:MAG TPA: hypothetical protein VGC11_02655 [Acidimicrobiia bacterium]|jgi:hypothetical protein
MATDKRERQRANRAVKEAVESKAARRQRWFRLAKRLLIWGVVVGGVIVLASLVFGGDAGAAAGGV